MLPQVEHRFFAEIRRDDAETLTVPLEPDWVPPIEDSRLQSMRDSAVAPLALPARARICPRWDATAGAPHVSHVEVIPEAPGMVSATVPLQYFAGAVQHGVSNLVEAGKIGAGETYRWQIVAYRAPQAARDSAAADLFEVEELASPVPVPAVRLLSKSLAGAQYHGLGATPHVRADVPVLIAPQVLREAAQVATAAGALEAGGILLGKLSRDATSGDLFVDVTAQIPAREAIAEAASLRFTPATWAAVQPAIGLRHEGESIVGWWHSHPQSVWLCRNCPPGRRVACPSNRAFFSTADVAFHRTAFQAAHNIALLLSFLDDPAPRFDVFGWHRGMVGERGYYITDCSTEAHQ